MDTLADNDAATALELELDGLDLGDYGAAANDAGAGDHQTDPDPREVREQAALTSQFLIAAGAAVVGKAVPAAGDVLTGEVLTTGEQRLAAVLLKYDGQLPPWLLRWKEEFLLAGWLAATGYGVYRAHLDHKKANGDEKPGSQPAEPEHPVSGAERWGEVSGGEAEPGAPGSQAGDSLG